jgi:hypothetical protein
VTFVLSLLLHGLALLLVVPNLPLAKKGGDGQGDTSGPLAVQLTPRKTPSPTPAPTPPREAPPPTVAPPPPRVAQRPRPTPPVITAAPRPPAVALPPPPPPVVAAPAPVPPPPIEGDLQSYVEARRRARGETGEGVAPGSGDAAKAAADETARRDRLVAANMGQLQSSTFGNEAKNGGGTFQLRNLGYDSADFTFFGWNKDIKRRTFQVIEVRKGDAESINIAVVRKIISIIREHEQGDFRWESKRLGRDITLSARPADNSSLESFMLEEFFTSSHQPR